MLRTNWKLKLLFCISFVVLILIFKEIALSTPTLKQTGVFERFQFDANKELQQTGTNAKEEVQQYRTNIKIACFLLATLNSREKLAAVNETWVPKCDTHFYIVSTDRGGYDIVNVSIPEGRTYLTDKTVYAFRYMYKHLMNDYDWFVKADDDTYMIIENLKFFLSHYKRDAPACSGLHLRHFAPNGYMAGGPGYVLNRAALKLLIKGFNTPGLCRLTGGAEDLEIGRCLTKVGVSYINSLDRFNTQTFQGTNLDSYRKDTVMSYVHIYLRNTHNLNKLSRFTISFHHMTPEKMRELHFILYNIQVMRSESTGYDGYFDTNVVQPMKNVSKTDIMEYFYEKKSEYDDIETWRKKNATVLSNKSPKRNR